MSEDLKGVEAAADKIVEEADKLKLKGEDRAGLDSAVTSLRHEMGKVADRRAQADNAEEGDGDGHGDGHGPKKATKKT